MEVKLEKFVPGGQALGVLPDGKKIFAWGGLPNETVEIGITKSKKNFAEGIVTKIINANPHRIKPKDDCFVSTSPWQIMDYNFELEQKAELIKEAFGQEGIDNLADINIETDGNEYFYRNKMEYSLWWDNDTEKISLAFHKRGTHRKAPIDGSSIERPEIFAEATRIVDELNANGDEARRYQALMLRANQNGEVSGGLLENGKPHPKFKTLTDTILGHKYTYSPNGFFQINIPVYEMALMEIKKHIDADLPIVDMYSGVGTIGLSIAGAEQSVALVETNKDAYMELEKNCHNVENAQPALSAAENALEYIKYDINLIVDPPRAGLDNALTESILEKMPRKVIYLSCNPTTQARDIAKLLTKYNIAQIVGFNFFPRTPHIENLIVLERKND